MIDSGLVSKKTAILHFALEPTSGVWSVMRDVAKAQVESGRYSAVAMGVVASKRWPEFYRTELAATGLPSYLATTVDVFGTAQFLFQLLVHPPIAKWAADLQKTSGAEDVVIHMHNAWLSGVFVPLGVEKSFPVKVVVTFHGVCTDLADRPVRRWLHRLMARRLLQNPVILSSVDSGNLAQAERILGVPAENFSVVPNGVAVMADHYRPQWKGEGEFVVGYIGLLSEHKGWRIVGEAVKLLRGRGRNIRFVLAGAGPDEDDVCQEVSKYSEFMHFEGLLRDPRRQIMSRLHALALMSTYEGLPMILIEAASVGLPTIATATGGVREVVIDGLNGMIVRRTVDDVIASLEALHDHPDRWQAMSQAARKVHAAKFDIRNTVAQYDLLYQRAKWPLVDA
jgi:glycosyltransferase involved in cell wall biosynthesis